MADIEDSLPPENRVLLDSLHCVQKGKTAEAFEMIENALQEAARSNQMPWLRTLYEHGATLSHIAGDRSREIGYKEQALQYVNDYPFALHNLAVLLLQDGQVAKAKSYAAKAFQLTATGQAAADRDLTAALLEQWPDLALDR